jgi:membrane associated rhomboid family serine protease
VGTLNWFLGRAVAMALVGTLGGALLVSLYCYQGDETFLPRQLEWEAHVLDTQNLPPEMVEMIIEESRNEQRLHLEELAVVFFGSIGSCMGGLVVSCCFLGRGRRLRQPTAVQLAT